MVRPGAIPPTGSPVEAPDPREDAFAALQQAITSSRAQQERVGGQLDESMGRSEQIERSRRAHMDPLMTSLHHRLNRPMPEPPGAPPKGDPAPQSNFAQGMSEWVSAMSIVGLLAGMIGRKSATTALTAFGAGMQGFAQGNLQEFEKQFKIWKANNDRVIQHHEMMLRQYEAVLRSDQYDVERKRNELMLISQQWGAQADYEVLRQKGLTEFARNLQQHEYHLERMRSASERIEMQRETTLAKIEAAAAKASGISNIYSPAGLEWIASQPPQYRKYYEWLLQNKRPDLFSQLMQAVPPRPGQPTAPPSGPPALPGDQ